MKLTINRDVILAGAFATAGGAVAAGIIAGIKYFLTRSEVS